MNDVLVHFEINGPGWADLRLELRGQCFTLRSISYCTDAIGDLLRFALQIAVGSEEASASFDREPAEWRLVANSLLDTDSKRGPVQISVYEFPDVHRMLPLSMGDLVFRGNCDALAFASTVLREIKRILPDYEKFSTGLHPIPTSALRALEAALADP